MRSRRYLSRGCNFRAGLFTGVSAVVAASALFMAGSACAQVLEERELLAAEAQATDTAPRLIIDPYVGFQVLGTDNVTLVATQKVPDFISRPILGLDADVNTGRLQFKSSLEAYYDYYAEEHAYNGFNVDGNAAANYWVLPNFLSVTGAFEQTTSNSDSYGASDLPETITAPGKYTVTTGYVGPRLTSQIFGLADVNIAARYGKVIYSQEIPASVVASGTADTDVADVTGVLDTKGRFSKLELQTLGEFERTDRGFEGTTAVQSAFLTLPHDLRWFGRAGYDHTSDTGYPSVNAPFWSTGLEYTNGDMLHLQGEGGRRYDRPYFAGDVQVKITNNFYLIADYYESLEPDVVLIANSLENFEDLASLTQGMPEAPQGNTLVGNPTNNALTFNRNTTARLVYEWSAETFTVGYDSVLRKEIGSNLHEDSILASAEWDHSIRPDLTFTTGFEYASDYGTGFSSGGTATPSGGQRYEVSVDLKYLLNSHTTATFGYYFLDFRDPTGAANSYYENILFLRVIRKFH